MEGLGVISRKEQKVNLTCYEGTPSANSSHYETVFGCPPELHSVWIAPAN